MKKEKERLFKVIETWAKGPDGIPEPIHWSIPELKLERFKDFDWQSTII